MCWLHMTLFPQKGDSLHRTLNHLCLPQLYCKMYESKQLHLCAVSLIIESICSSYAMLPQHLACLFTPVSSTQSLLTFGWTVCWLLFFSAWQIRSSEDSDSWLKAKSSMSLRQACHHRSAAAWDKAIHGADRRWERVVGDRHAFSNRFGHTDKHWSNACIYTHLYIKSRHTHTHSPQGKHNQAPSVRRNIKSFVFIWDLFIFPLSSIKYSCETRFYCLLSNI